MGGWLVALAFVVVLLIAAAQDRAAPGGYTENAPDVCTTWARGDC